MNSRMIASQKITEMPVFTSVQTGLLQRTCACGGAATLSGECTECHQKRLTCQSALIQPKLTVNQPGDRYEQEADRVADSVMRMPTTNIQRQSVSEDEEETMQAKLLASQITPLVQRQVEEEEEEEEQVQAKLMDFTPVSVLQRQMQNENEEDDNIFDRGGNISASPADFQVSSGSGQSLPDNVRDFMEPRFGYDFSQVKIHSDHHAYSMARKLNARAFTFGRDIFFNDHEYLPDSHEGRRLLAHELTHVVQQDQLGKSDSINSLNEQRIQRYLVGPPERIDTNIQTGPTYGTCRNFNLEVSWDTDVRDGYILQECINADSITKCDGTTVKAPNTPHYWEAWEVDASGNVSDGNLDTWFRARRAGTRGWWTFDANVFAVHALDSSWNFKRNSVGTAGSLLATTTGPSHDELYQPSMIRHRGGVWDCCIPTPYHLPI